MKNSDTYKGYEYQKKCALLWLFKEMHKDDFTCLRMEDPNGDDFDLVYNNEIKVFQSKKVETPQPPKWMRNLWRRYNENIKDKNDGKHILLFFVFANIYTHETIQALFVQNHQHDELNEIFVSVGDTSKYNDWLDFLSLLTVYFKSEDEIESDFFSYIYSYFSQCGLNDDDYELIFDRLIGRLVRVMSVDKIIQKEEVNRIIAQLYGRYCEKIPIIKQREAEIRDFERERYEQKLKEQQEPVNIFGENDEYK